MDQHTADEFAAEWIAVWNAHDLDAILAHYADDVEFTSPFVRTIAGEASGTLRGRAALRAYWSRALTGAPDLRFELIRVLPGVSSVTLYYRSSRKLLAAEVMELDNDGRVRRGLAHYTPE